MSLSPEPPIDLQAARSQSDLGAALRRASEVIGLGIIPVAVLVRVFVVGLQGGPISGDFHHELYPEAKLLLQGENPFPSPDAPIGGANFVWPPVAAYLVSPLTLLPVGAADVSWSLLGLACFALALWLVGVRDWRVYGGPRSGRSSPARCASRTHTVWPCCWRPRGSGGHEGAPRRSRRLRVAVKFFVWPLAIWLAATRRWREAALAVMVAGASLPTACCRSRRSTTTADALSRVREVFGHESYNIFGLDVQAGASDGVAHAGSVVVGLVLLAGVWRYQSFALAVGTALVLSPISWLDYYALAALPLAVVRPRLSAIWFLPLVTWGLEGAGMNFGDVPSTLRLLLVFAVVLGVAFKAERGAGKVTPAMA